VIFAWGDIDSAEGASADKLRTPDGREFQISDCRCGDMDSAEQISESAASFI
jgi:hypothetical protein